MTAGSSDEGCGDWSSLVESVLRELSDEDQSQTILVASPNRRYAVLLYDVYEFHMGADKGRIAVLDTDRPQQVMFRSSDVWWYANPISAPVVWATDNSILARPLIASEPVVFLCDVDARKFCFIHGFSGNLTDIRVNEAGISIPHASRSDLREYTAYLEASELYWFELARLKDLLAVYSESAAHFGIVQQTIRRNRIGEVIDVVLWLVSLPLLGPLYAFDWIAQRLRRNL